jgi:hypothetical protein
MATSEHSELAVHIMRHHETRGFPVLFPEVFPCFFLSCKANVRVKLANTGHDPHSSTLVVICVVRLLFVLFYVLFVCKNVYCHRGDNPIAVNKYINLTMLPTAYTTPRRTARQLVNNVVCVVLLLFVLFYVLFVCKCLLPPGVNPIAVNKYIIFKIMIFPRVTVLWVIT